MQKPLERFQPHLVGNVLRMYLFNFMQIQGLKGTIWSVSLHSTDGHSGCIIIHETIQEFAHYLVLRLKGLK